MVGLQAMVLGRMGRSPPLIQERVLYPAHRHLRAGAAGAPAFILVAGRGSCARKRRGVPADVAGAPYIQTQGHRPFYCRWPRCTDSSSLNVAFTLRLLRVARDLEWCEHDYPRWGG